MQKFSFFSPLLFFAENRLVRMAELPKMQVEIGETSVEAAQNVEYKNEQYFDGKKTEANQKLKSLLNLDAAKGVSANQDSAEAKLFKDLSGNIDSKFKTLKDNYRKEAAYLGEGGELEKRFNVYKGKVEEFLSRMKFNITQINLEQGSEAAKQQEAEKLFHSYFSKKEVYGKDAFMPYLAKAIIADSGSFDALKAAKDPQAVAELFAKWFEGGYTGNFESPLLQLAIKSMYESLPSFEAKDGEKAYFNLYLQKKPEFVAKFGARNTEKVVDVLAKRFDITFEGNNPDYFVDLSANYKCVLGKDAEAYLDSVIKSDFTNAESVAKVETKLDGTKTTRDKAYKAMTESAEAGDYIDDLADFKASPEVATVLNMAQSYQNNKNRMVGGAGMDNLATLSDPAMQPTYESVKRNLTAEKISALPRKSGENFGDVVAQILKMINELINGKDSKGLARANRDLEQGLNPVKSRDAFREDCKTLCAKKPLDQMLATYMAPGKVDGILKNKKGSPYFSDVLAREAVTTALNDKLAISKLALSGDKPIEKSGDNYVIKVKKIEGADQAKHSVTFAANGEIQSKDGVEIKDNKPKIGLAQDKFAPALAALFEVEKPKTIADFLVASHNKGTLKNGVLTLSSIGATDYIHNVLKPDANIPKDQAVFVIKNGKAIKIEKGKAMVANNKNVDTWVLASGQSYEYSAKKTKISAGKRVLVDTGDKIVLASKDANNEKVLAMLSPPSGGKA